MLELESCVRRERVPVTANRQKPDVLVEVRDMRTHFPVRKGLFSRAVATVKAVDGISFEIMRGETLGLVGESGSGKTTVGRTLLRLIEPTGGQILVEGEDLTSLSPQKLRLMRRRLQMIFQDPYASINPRMRVEDVIAEPLQIQGMLDRTQIDARVSEMMDLVGLPEHFRGRYPHEFSGGQHQRIVIARALVLSPDLIVCDESIASLDVSIQAQIVNLLQDIQNRLGLTFLFIAHDLSMVRHISERIAVMYLGKIMELSDSDSICDHPLHPYTQALISAVPMPDPVAEMTRERIVLEGDIPSPSSPPTGCVFSTRCRHAQSICSQEPPEYLEVNSGHFVACHFAGIL